MMYGGFRRALIGLRFSRVAREYRAHGLGKCARNFAAFWRMTVVCFYARRHGRATVSLSQAQVIAALEVLSRAL